MCKSHFKETKTELIDKTQVPPDNTPPPPPEGPSVYDKIIPESIGFTPSTSKPVMPLIQHLEEGFRTSQPRGWHRNAERRARGLHPVASPAVQLEGWERELVWLEICILSGCAGASFRQLARAWGRDKGFHTVLANFICERRGNVQRKRRAKSTQRNRSTTKKARRPPATMEPTGSQTNGTTDPAKMEAEAAAAAAAYAEEFDHFPFMSGLVEVDYDPTYGFVGEDPDAICMPVGQSLHPPGLMTTGKRGKRLPLTMGPIDNGEPVVPFHPGKVLTPETLVMDAPLQPAGSPSIAAAGISFVPTVPPGTASAVAGPGVAGTATAGMGATQGTVGSGQVPTGSEHLHLLPPTQPRLLGQVAQPHQVQPQQVPQQHQVPQHQVSQQFVTQPATMGNVPGHNVPPATTQPAPL